MLDQSLICSNISSLHTGPWLEELKALNIEISDVDDLSPTELLIGASVARKLYTGRREILTCGLVLVETLLEWTFMGRISARGKRSASLVTLSLLLNHTTLIDLWNVNVLRIASFQ